LAHDKDDQKTERELLAEGVEDDSKGDDWTVAVTTAKDKPPTSDVVLTIYGENGKSEELPLSIFTHDGKPFAQGTNEEFKVQFCIKVTVTHCAIYVVE
jgi:hypothetical protein